MRSRAWAPPPRPLHLGKKLDPIWSNSILELENWTPKLSFFY